MAQAEKTALVLAAGGVFGAYQAGVWKALEHCFQPDLVVGASIGSINGWLIAGGCPAAELEDLWLNGQQHLRIRPRMPRHWSHGCLDLSAVESILAELFARYTPRIEYATVVTDVRERRPRLVTAAEMTWRHLQASCAVPLAFDLQRLDGRIYADGGLFGAVPLWAAVELGATRIVAVHSLPAPPLLWRLAANAGRRVSNFHGGPPTQVETILITPETPLGSFFEFLRYRPDRVQRWIASGEADAQRAKASIVKSCEGQ